MAPILRHRGGKKSLAYFGAINLEEGIIRHAIFNHPVKFKFSLTLMLFPIQHC